MLSQWSGVVSGSESGVSGVSERVTTDRGVFDDG